jgi:uncharacterized protein YaaR (DUF327 family)
MIEITPVGQLECNAVASVDHIRPQSLGGTNDIKNCVLACKFCNNIKSSKHEFIGFKNLKKTLLTDSDYSEIKSVLKAKTQIVFLEEMKELVLAQNIEKALNQLNTKKELSNCISYMNNIASFIQSIMKTVECVKTQVERIISYITNRLDQIKLSLTKYNSNIQLAVFKVINGKICETLIEV